jgi:outer membrane immunogenic protein
VFARQHWNSVFLGLCGVRDTQIRLEIGYTLQVIDQGKGIGLMKKILLATIALTSIAVASSYAADLGRRPAPRAEPAYAPAVPVYNWSGLYIGGHIGGAFGGNDFFGNDGGRFMGGGQIGADYQFSPNWVFGIEANYSFVDSHDSSAAYFANRNLGSVTGRLGYAWGPALLYAKGGYAWADTRHSFGFGDEGDSGYTVGGGIEYMVAQNWSTKLEYQYYNFGDVNFTPTTPPFVTTTYKNDEHTIKLGLNYRFNWGAMGSTRGY